ncbi:MAG: GMC family oxidoreductase [Actinomycetota bacterium]|nr:GMC family oxidoreductase [Actinomycetota bacterium]
MLQDAADITSTTLTADVVVIGAGPAGLVVASELAESGASVLVLEAGGLPYDRAERRNTFKAIRDHRSGAQSLTRGSGSGEPYFPLRLSRARGLGGSTNALRGHGLRGRPMDAVDFGPRFGVEWPVTYDEFASVLPIAEDYCGMRGDDEGPLDWSSCALELGSEVSHNVVAAPFRHGRKTQFTDASLVDSVRAQMSVVTSAVVVGMDTDGVGRVAGLDVRSLGGNEFRVMADTYVLATGGIDNARMLLNSRPLLYLMDGAADHVGRYFMEHLHYVPAFLIAGSREVAEELGSLVGAEEHPDHWISLDPDTVRREELLRLAYLPVPVHKESLEPAVPATGELLRMVPYGPFGIRGRLRQAATAAGGLRHIVRAMAARARGGTGGDVFALSVMAEQPPDRASRVTLSGKIDRMGTPLPHLHWRVGVRDFEDARRSTELLAAEMGRLGMGRVLSLWDRGEQRPPVVTGGWHHMGTTRMSSDPDNGVVDANCRLHGVDNMYVAGSSVFPTSGYANPTLTLVALAVRLGRHLAL